MHKYTGDLKDSQSQLYFDNTFTVEGATRSGIFTNHHQAQSVKYI
jgi:hypothetical protein